MIKDRSIFLSASVPDPNAKHYMGGADIAAISALVSALLFVALGRRQIIWGGHPAITPMIWAYAEALNVDYGRCVTLYQSEFFQDDFPEENARFRNVIVTKAVKGDREQSLEIMRRRMLSENMFEAAIFAGGMGGIFDEYRLVRELAPEAKVLPIVSTGGAAAALGAEVKVSSDLVGKLDYVELLFDQLSVDPNESRNEQSP